MSHIKTDRVVKYLTANQSNGYIDERSDAIACKLEVSYALVAKIAKTLGIRFKREYKMRRYAPKQDIYVAKIKEMLRENPGMTFEEMGNRLGVSRQRAHYILQKCGIEKSRNGQGYKQEQKILELIRTTEIPEDIGDMCVSNFLKLKGINYHTFKKYIDIHADDPEVIAFMSRFNARYKRRIAVIIKYLKETGLMIKDIAKELNETESRISRINRRYNIRPAKTKKYTPGEYEPE